MAQKPQWEDLIARVRELKDDREYAQAIPVALEALRVAKVGFGRADPKFAASLHELALIYYAQGEDELAEKFLKQAISIRKKNSRKPGNFNSRLELAESLRYLGELYLDHDRYPEADPLFKQLLVVDQLRLLFDPGAAADPWIGPKLATDLNNVAALYEIEGRSADADRLNKQALGIWHKVYATWDDSWLLSEVAEGYQLSHHYKTAEPLLKQVLGISQEELNRASDHPTVVQLAGFAQSLNGLAVLYRSMGRYAEAEPLFKRALATYQESLGSDHQTVGIVQRNLAWLYYAWGRPKDAQSYFDLSISELADQFDQQFAYKNENERLTFLNDYSVQFDLYLSFASTYAKQDFAISSRVYDLLLWEKEMVARSVAAERARLRAGNDDKAIALFDELTAKWNEYAALASIHPKNLEQWQENLNTLHQAATNLDKELALRSVTFAESKRSARPSWREVRDALGKDDAAIEIARFLFVDGKKWTGESKYTALVLTPGSKSGPSLVDLGDAAVLEGTLEAAYYRRISASPSGGSLVHKLSRPAGNPLAFYEAFWKPLLPALGGAKHIYISTDGVLNQVALGLIPTPGGRPLMEIYDLRLVNRTADLLQPHVTHTDKTAVLFANPYFDVSETDYRSALTKLVSTERRSQSPKVPSLDQTAKTLGGSSRLAQLRSLEIGLQEDIAPLLKQHGWKPEPYYFEQNATVEAIEQMRAPRLLHIATHGAFLPDPVAKPPNLAARSTTPPLISDPMLRSRLYFAGANHALAGDAWPADLSNGVLTAYQASTLNLYGTELVVLSACDTGRGDVQNGEGVFGLRRAFQEAGAESVLMSLWEVPAKETQELLDNFYHYWLEGSLGPQLAGDEVSGPCLRQAPERDRMNKYDALVAAQQDERRCVKKRYGSDLPYYWGAFILVGD